MNTYELFRKLVHYGFLISLLVVLAVSVCLGFAQSGMAFSDNVFAESLRIALRLSAVSAVVLLLIGKLLDQFERTPAESDEEWYHCRENHQDQWIEQQYPTNR